MRDIDIAHAALRHKLEHMELRVESTAMWKFINKSKVPTMTNLKQVNLRSERRVITVPTKHLLHHLPEGTIRPGRRVGNTTRQINQAMEWLLQGLAVEVVDHTQHWLANRDLIKRIIRRIHSEDQLLISYLELDPRKGVIFPAAATRKVSSVLIEEND